MRSSGKERDLEESMVPLKRVIQVGCNDLSENSFRYVSNALRSGSLVNGVYTKRFEKTFAELHGASYGIFMNSGTDALRIAIAALKEAHHWKNGDEILCPATTFVASANVIIQNGLRVRFVDVDPSTFNIRPDLIAGQVGSRTRALVVVHLFGLPADMSAIVKIARKHRLKIVEDSCETMFVEHKGKPIGSFGDIGCFSTYMAHIITTGVGGLAITNNEQYADLMRSYQNHGRDPIYLGGNDGKHEIGNESILRHRFRFDRVGYSSRVTEMEAALGLAQLERFEEIIRKRQNVADQLIRKGYAAGLQRYIQFPIYQPDYTQNARMMFPLLMKQGFVWMFASYLEYYGIETRPLMPLISQPVYRKMFGNIDKKFPVAAKFENRGLYIGCHQKMSEEDTDYIIKVMKGYFSA